MGSDEALESATTTRSWNRGDTLFAAAGLALVAVSALRFDQAGLVLGLVPFTLLAYAAWAGTCLASRKSRHRFVGFAILPAIALLLAVWLLWGFSPAGSVPVRALPFLVLGAFYALGYATGHAHTDGGRLFPGFLCATAVLIALATFAANGISIGWSGVFLFALPAVTGLALWLSQRRSFPFGARVLLAVTLGFSATWMGVLWNVQDYDPNTRSRWNTIWVEEDDAGNPVEVFQSQVVTGFPIQAIEGHGGGGAPEWLPAEKGLVALIANFLFWTAAFAAVAAKVPKLALWPLSWTALGLAALCGLLGFWKLVWLLD